MHNETHTHTVWASVCFWPAVSNLGKERRLDRRHSSSPVDRINMAQKDTNIMKQERGRSGEDDHPSSQHPSLLFISPSFLKEHGVGSTLLSSSCHICVNEASSMCVFFSVVNTNGVAQPWEKQMQRWLFSAFVGAMARCWPPPHSFCTSPWVRHIAAASHWQHSLHTACCQ